MEGSLRQKKRKRAELEPVSSGNVAMKLEVARSKVALEAEVKQKEDALRLLRESINANLHMQADYQDFKRRARWLTGDMKVMQRKYNNQSAVIADLNSRLLEQHDKDLYMYDTRRTTQVKRRAMEARTECKTAKPY